MRKLLTVAATLLTAAAVATPASATPLHHHGAFGSFTTWHDGATAITYDQEKVPVGAKVAVIPFAFGNRTTITLWVYGLLPNRHYGAHVHIKPCGPTPADAGSHFQNVPDPVQPSVDPAYANPQNEVWLDFGTDDHGAAIAVATVNWRFAGRQANAVVIHNEHTHTEPGQAGTAGPRLACVNSTFP
ncbi:superoxide dismutase family protein [Actinokineospora inagensis]|uniref:superoxide dismutase family protein n=1 Tax=Actinokineospora inagensis TaxID=103730 RepID=UPI0003F4C6F1|nr:superoxide dismutase family protein [Actinokineospora inagensis]